MSTGHRFERAAERGAALATTALVFVVIVIVAAVVIDLAAARNDRAGNQVAADGAATAAAAALGELGGGVEACTVAVDYFEEIADRTVAGLDCTTFPTVCDATTPSVAETGTVDGFTLRIVHPVDDTDSLMQSSAIGAPGETVVAADGDRCGRVGVDVTEVRSSFFAGIVNRASLQTSIHAVALYIGGDDATRAINLLLLEREECDVLVVSGSGAGDGGVVVGAAPDDVTGELQPGRIQIDSDGSSGCAGNGTIDVNGADARVQADGPPGCPGELAPVGSGAGCGLAATFAPGPPGCVLPACSSTGVVAPTPVRTDERLTRAPIDWRYNCKLSYPGSYDIDDCPYASTTPPYIDQLVAAIGSSGIPVGFQSYTAAGHPCVTGGVGPPEVIPQGNWVIDCNLVLNRSIRFEGGNLVFDGNISIQSDAKLQVNKNNTGSYTWTPGTALDPTLSSANATFMYLRDGELQKTGDAEIDFDNVMVYLADNSSMSIAGGSGAIDWIAPSEGPFDDLALWSESNGQHSFSGQTSLAMEGAFFAPLATVDYSGTGNQHSVAAQFIANKLHVSGSGLLNLVPTRHRGVLIPTEPSALIR